MFTLLQRIGNILYSTSAMNITKVPQKNFLCECTVGRLAISQMDNILIAFLIIIIYCVQLEVNF